MIEGGRMKLILKIEDDKNEFCCDGELEADKKTVREFLLAIVRTLHDDEEQTE